MKTFNPDFAFEIVMRVSNAMQIGVSGYFLAEEIVIYFEIKKCSEMLSCAAVGSRNRFSNAKSGLNILFTTRVTGNSWIDLLNRFSELSALNFSKILTAPFYNLVQLIVILQQ